MSDRPPTPLLDTIHSPADLKTLDRAQLRQVADELRTEIIDAVSVTGGHLGAGLGVVELTVALHAVFNTPEDRLIWDVGHQAYPHKVLTGRRDRIRTLRQKGGLSGFTRRAESPYDPFGAGHSSTSISAGLGMAIATALKGETRNVVAVIGDGAMSAGMAYEAMNNAGAADARLIVILNDNDMSIAPPTGAMSAYLARLVSSPAYRGLRNVGKQLANVLPPFLKDKARRTEEFARGWWTGGTLFEELGFYYVGPIDGHNIDHLLPVLQNVRDAENGPILVHVVTKKGKGYEPAETSADKYHGVSKFNVITGAQAKAPSNAPSYTNVFAESLIDEARRDDRIVAVTAAMPSGTGLDKFAEIFPTRIFDVGIAEQHAVTFAAGLASEGMKPFAAIYSTFLQRAYDQVIHDVAVQGLPVRFAIDRAGYVGADGPTHAGNYDTAYLGAIPGIVVMAAADEAELKHMVATAAAHDSGPIAFRYPRGDGLGVDMPEHGSILPIGKGRIVKQGSGVALLSFGTRLGEALAAAEKLGAFGLTPTVADARFLKPLDEELLTKLAQSHDVLITLEESGIGGFGSLYSTFLQRAYDQVIHDVAVQGLPVRFAIDRAGYVGADGPTHAGNYDAAYLGAIPGIVVMAAADEAELKHMVATAAAHDSGPIAFRYPRGDGLGVDMPEHGSILPIGKGRIVKQGSGVALLSFGTRLGEALAAAEKLGAFGLTPTVADARFLKPLDEELVAKLAQSHDVLITLEESSIGGFGSHVATFLAQHGLLDGKLKFRPLMIPDSFTEQASQADMYAAAGLDRAGIVATVLDTLGRAEPRLVTGGDKLR